jgi:hypothetical protein
VLARRHGLLKRRSAQAGHGRIKHDVDRRVVDHRVQVGGPLGNLVHLSQFPDLRLVASDQDRLDLNFRAVFEGKAAVVADGEDGTEQVLAVTHSSGDAVHGDADRLCFETHVSSSDSGEARVIGKR